MVRVLEEDLKARVVINLLELVDIECFDVLLVVIFGEG